MSKKSTEFLKLFSPCEALAICCTKHIERKHFQIKCFLKRKIDFFFGGGGGVRTYFWIWWWQIYWYWVGILLHSLLLEISVSRLWFWNNIAHKNHKIKTVNLNTLNWTHYQILNPSSLLQGDIRQVFVGGAFKRIVSKIKSTCWKILSTIFGDNTLNYLNQYALVGKKK